MSSRRRVPSVTPPALSREVVVDAALRLVDTQGFDAMTMRAVAGELGVVPMALYRHVTDKRDLVDAVLDRAMARVELPAVDSPWRSRHGPAGAIGAGDPARPPGHGRPAPRRATHRVQCPVRSRTVDRRAPRQRIPRRRRGTSDVARAHLCDRVRRARSTETSRRLRPRRIRRTTPPGRIRPARRPVPEHGRTGNTRRDVRQRRTVRVRSHHDHRRPRRPGRTLPRRRATTTVAM